MASLDSRRPSMGKSDVSMFTDVDAQITDNHVTLTLSVQEAVKALGVSNND